MKVVLILLAVAFVVLWIVWRRFKRGALAVSEDTCCGFYGAPGSGKTYSSYQVIADAYLRQLARYEKCQSKLFGWIRRKLHPSWNIEPTIYSSIPMQIYGKHRKVIYQAEQLTVEHLLLLSPLSEGASIYIGEFGKSVASQFDYDNPYVKENLTQLVSWIRQWICKDIGRLVIDEQASSSIVKNVRIRLGHQYELSNFHRFLFFRYAYVDVKEFQCTGDELIELKHYNKKGVEVPQYFLWKFPYSWEKRKCYDTYCYSDIYLKGMSHKPDFDYSKSLKTCYIPTIECTYDETQLYKRDREKFKEFIYNPMHKRCKPSLKPKPSIPLKQPASEE